MPSKLSEFISVLKAKGFSHQNMFEFTLIPPQDLTQIISGDSIKLWCSAANTPGYNFLSEEEYIEVSDRRKYVYDYSKTDLNLTFYVDADSKILELFNKWKKLIFISGRKINYYSDYVGQGTLDLLNRASDKQGEAKIAYTYEYVDLFPSNIGQLNYDWNNSGIQTLQVSFHYKEVSFQTPGRQLVAETTPSGDTAIEGTGIKFPSATNGNKFFNSIGNTGDLIQTVVKNQESILVVEVVSDLGKTMESSVNFATDLNLGSVKETAGSLGDAVGKTKGLVAGSIDAVNGTISGILGTYNAAVDSAVALYDQATDALDLTNIGMVLGETAEILGESTQAVNDLITFFPNSSRLRRISDGLGAITTATSGASEASTQAGNTQPQDSTRTTVNKTLPAVKSAIEAFKKFK